MVLKDRSEDELEAVLVCVFGGDETGLGLNEFRKGI